MTNFWLNNPLTQAMLFYPRKAQPGRSLLPDVHDGTISAGSGVELGYRFYHNDKAKGLLLLFHGNAEIVTDSDYVAPLYLDMGLSLYVAEYRGYGWSSDKPRADKLLADAEAHLHNLPQILQQHDLVAMPLFLLGRSLGSASAVHLAHQFPARFQGLIVESGFAHEPLIMRALGIPRWLLKKVPSLFGNAQKITSIELPTLIIHGERDTLIPIEHGEALYRASVSSHKTFVSVANVGHNDLIANATGQYVEAIANFVTSTLDKRL